MRSWRDAEPMGVDLVDPASGPGPVLGDEPTFTSAPLSLRHILGAPATDTWWSLHRTLLWSAVGWVTSGAVVFAAGYLLWAMMFHHVSENDPLLGLPRPRATSTTADPDSNVVEALKRVRPAPLGTGDGAGTGGPASTGTLVAGPAATESDTRSGDGSGRSGPNSGPGGPAAPTTRSSAGATTSPTVDDNGGNRGPGGGGGATTTAAPTTSRSTTTSSGATSTTRSTSSSSTSTTADDKGGGSGSGSGGSGSGGSGSGGSGSGGSGSGGGGGR